ncbi:uncharacterized protein HMPREF1541_06651 [Cyphellophora europaea CBS 101466]|uniref:Major facilitator superfamily (MFS) profile domain-containing protein n=1 Tax=Cyphellophora europaea (strain CBS 101466) TaxID=1220924 RepID=W2RSB5_CYPE1|nr:uncharacterized protein HMPREF1541_06651 [Cyphellophora europaea CBS 101466]ETN38614.1 hypothetical protein HMPREF1541_06651 [Cyphellophora europaea CBS 101466]
MAHKIKRYQLDNPLFHHYSNIDVAARAFAKEIDADEELCIKAARIACDPPTWDSVEGRTEVESRALRDEREQGFFQQPKALKIAIITLCFSAMVQGWIQSVINGANQTLPEYFGWKLDEPGAPGQPGEHRWVNNGPAIWKFAGINAITYLTAGIFGCWVSDPLQSSLLGRRGAIFASACLCVMASIGAASVQKSHWWHLLIWRALLGLGLGAKASVTPIFGAEISPNHLRGTLLMNWQLFDALGIFCGFSANLIFYWTDRLAWRFQIASACIPAGCLIVLIWTIPESPRWLLKKGKGPEAFAALCALRQTPLQAATELFFANAQIQKEIDYMRRRATKGDTNYWSRILQLFLNDRTRRSAVAATVVMFGQQLCGVNVLAFYSTVFIQDINGQSTRNVRALWLSWGLGLANFLFTFPAYWWIDKYGRRFLLLATYPGMIVSLFAACLSFLGDAGSAADDKRIIRVCFFIFLFILFYSLGQGPVAFAYSAEVFPLWNREAGMSLAVFVNLTGAGLLTLFVPRAQVSSKTYTQSGSSQGVQTTDEDGADPAWLSRQATLVGVFVGFCTLSFILVYLFVPETKLATTREDNRRTLNYISLEELNQIFLVRTHECIHYYIGHVAWGTLNNFLYRFGLRKEKVIIEESMHYWVKDGLKRKKQKQAQNETTQAKADSSETETSDEKAEQGGGQAVHVENRSSRGTSPTVEDDDVIQRAPSSTGLPQVSDTGGSLDFKVEDKATSTT